MVSRKTGGPGRRPELRNAELHAAVAKRALELRIASYSINATRDKVNEEFPGLNISATTVTVWVNQMLKPQVDETVEQYREQMLARVAEARKAVWPRVMKGDEKAGAYYLRLEQKEADLRGLDKPIQVELTAAPSDDALEVARMLESMDSNGRVIQGEVVGRSEG
jgi:hypothetical protein